MNEHSFIRSIHRKLPADVYVWKINDNYQGGVADAYYSLRGGNDLWVEYKYLPKLPKRPDTPVHYGLSALQLDWLRARQLDGRNVLVIVGSPQGHRVLSHSAWEKPTTCMEFISSAIDTPQVVAYILETLQRNQDYQDGYPIESAKAKHHPPKLD